MSAKHTPGPWVVGNDATQFGVKRGNGMEPLGFVYCPAFAERSDIGLRALADARLIAAAPELLAMVNLLTTCIENIGGEHVTGREGLDQVMGQAYALIAKATGEQP